MSATKLYPVNLPNSHLPRLNVLHSELTRSDAESAYKSQCPTCQVGLLLTQRAQRSLRLRREDCCIACGQKVLYMDEAINDESLPPVPVPS
jgi:hypothetical protein